MKDLAIPVTTKGLVIHLGDEDTPTKKKPTTISKQAPKNTTIPSRRSTRQSAQHAKKNIEQDATPMRPDPPNSVMDGDEKLNQLLEVFDPSIGARKRAKNSTVVNCAAGCGSGKNPTLQCDLCGEWSHTPCIEEHFGTPKSRWVWVCPGKCDNTPLWADYL